jgi:hypothetical protein
VSYSIKYQQAIETLAKPVTSEDGVPSGEIAAGEHRLSIQLPSALREYYLTAGRLDRLNRAHNRLYSPHDWLVDAGNLVFMEQNQLVVFWGIPINGDPSDDPPVLQGVNVIDQPIEWHLEHGSCCEFLLMMLHWQAVCSGMAFTASADISPMMLTRIRASWPFIGEMGGMLVFARDGSAACVIGEGDALQLFVGGRSDHDFNLIHDEFAHVGVKLEQV